MLPAPSKVLQLVLEYTFRGKATQKGNGIKSCSPTKGHAQISISGKSSKKNKKPFLRESRSVKPILIKKNAGKILSPEQVRNLRRKRGETR